MVYTLIKFLIFVLGIPVFILIYKVSKYHLKLKILDEGISIVKKNNDEIRKGLKKD